MAVLAVVTSSPPGVEGGHLVIARALVAAAQAAGHNANLVITPDHGFGRFASSYAANWRTDVSVEVGRPVDQVISLRYPSYAVRHPAHICWLNHTIREYYDLWPRFSASISARARLKERVRKGLIHAADQWLLRRNVTKVYAQSRTIERRLVTGLGLHTDVLYPPPPPRAYRCDGYGDYIFAVSRLTPLKRVDLLVRALAEPAARHVRAVIAGDGEERASLAALAATLGVSGRITFTETKVKNTYSCRFESEQICGPLSNNLYIKVQQSCTAQQVGKQVAIKTVVDKVLDRRPKLDPEVALMQYLADNFIVQLSKNLQEMVGQHYDAQRQLKARFWRDEQLLS